MRVRVRSAVDGYVSVLIGATILLLLVSVAWVPPEARLLAFGMVLPWVALLSWITWGTWYELRKYDLLCRSGPFRERIPYERIKAIRLTQNLLSSMALSRKRIEIRQHGKGYILGTTMISPVNREQFLEELRRRCPNLA